MMITVFHSWIEFVLSWNPCATFDIVLFEASIGWCTRYKQSSVSGGPARPYRWVPLVTAGVGSAGLAPEMECNTVNTVEVQWLPGVDLLMVDVRLLGSAPVRASLQESKPRITKEA